MSTEALQFCVFAHCSGVGVGHGFFPDVVAALEAVVRAPWHAGHSIGGLHLLQVAARRLAASSPEVGLAQNKCG